MLSRFLTWSGLELLQICKGCFVASVEGENLLVSGNGLLFTKELLQHESLAIQSFYGRLGNGTNPSGEIELGFDG